MINPFIVERALKEAFIEDNHYIDVTSDLLLPKETLAEGKMIAKAEGVICGIEVADRAFKLCDPNCQIEWQVAEGDTVTKGQVLMTLRGNARAILKAERIALNFLQRMSGVATLTRSFTQLISGSQLKLVDTRKTTPLFRPFEKYSVLMGGGFNHRYDLSDCVMLKDNHIAVFGSITKAIETAKARVGHTLKIEVEVETEDQLLEALQAEADIIMLDNMSDALMETCVEHRNAHVEKGGQYSVLEASGNVDASRLTSIARIGVDVVSSGALTHSYKALDISLKLSFQ